MEKFTAENYSKGFLIDEECLAGITEASDSPGTFQAFIVKHSTGESVGFQTFSNLFEAIRTLNEIPRNWSFEAISKCGSGNCGKGNCGKSGGCGKSQKTDSCETGAC